MTSFPAPQEPPQPLVEVLDVVGVTNYGGYAKNIQALAQHYALMSEAAQMEGFTGVLMREPDNPFDRNAVAVHIPAWGEKVGFLSAKDGTANRLAPLLDAGQKYLVNVYPRRDPNHPEQPGLSVRLTRVSS